MRARGREPQGASRGRGIRNLVFIRIRIDATPSTLSFRGLPNVKILGIEFEVTAPSGSTRVIVCDLYPTLKATACIVYFIVQRGLEDAGLPTWTDEGVEGCALLFAACTDAGSENQGFYKLVVRHKCNWVIVLWIWCLHHQINLIERRLLGATSGRGEKSRVPGTLRSIY